MTPEEKQMLTDLANKIAQTPAPEQDKEAADFIRAHIGSRPDALYLMTQTVLIQNLALEQARQEIEQLRRAAAQPGSSGTSFLGNAAPRPQTAGYSSAPPPSPASPASPMQYPSAPVSSGGAGSFLRSAATTAAGVAAGALAFEGIRSLFGGLEHLGGFGGPHMGSGFLAGAPSETIINNYYENPDQSTENVADTGDSDGSDGGSYEDTDYTSDSDDASGDDFSSDDSSI